MSRALDFCPGSPGIEFRQARVIFNYMYAYFSLFRLSCRKMDFVSPKFGFLEMEMCYEYLHKADHGLHSFSVYNQSLTTAQGSRLFGSVVRALNFCPGED